MKYSAQSLSEELHSYAPQGRHRWLRAVLALARDQVVSADFMNLHFIRSMLLLHITQLSSYSYASVTCGGVVVVVAVAAAVAMAAAAAVVAAAAAASASIKAHPFTCQVECKLSVRVSSARASAAQSILRYDCLVHSKWRINGESSSVVMNLINGACLSLIESGTDS